MEKQIYITHELIMKTTKYYSLKQRLIAQKDFDDIESLEIVKFANGKKYIKIIGTMHLYGYKIAGDTPYSGFYDVINQQYYSKDNIENAKIIEEKTETIIYKPKKLIKK